MFSVRAKITPRSFEYLHNLAGDFKASVEKAMWVVAGKAAKIAQKEYPMSGLRRRTGNLQDSIKGGVTRRGTGKQIKLMSDVVYARIHEKGGWSGRGKATWIPARPYLRPSIVRNKKKLAEEFEKAVYDYMNSRRRR